MLVSVRLSTALAQEIGAPRLTVTVGEGATVADLLRQLRADHPQAARLAIVLPVMAGQYVGPEAVLRADQEVALLLPVAGGSPHPHTGVPHDR